jgi:hypothetical protein
LASKVRQVTAERVHLAARPAGRVLQAVDLKYEEPMRNSTFVIAMAVALLVALAAPASAADPDGHLVSKDGRPVAQARVQFRGPGARYVAVSRHDGGFFLTNPGESPPADGTYRVRVRLGKLVHVFDEVVVDDGRLYPERLVLPW